MKERKRRSLAKAVSWRILATLIIILIAFIFTGKLVLSLSVGGRTNYQNSFLFCS